jgi:prolycopene isomerase
VIDPAIHLFADQPLYTALLRHLGVGDRVTFLPTDRLLTAVFPGVKVHVPLTTADELIDAHVQAFPAHAEEIRTFFQLCAQIHRGAHELPGEVPLQDLDATTERLPLIFKYRRATLDDVLRECISDPRVRALCGLAGFILGLPPSQLPFQAFAQFVFSYLAEGGIYCQGGVQQIIDAMAVSLDRNRAEVVRSTRVSRILVNDGQTTGVELATGRRLQAGVVISNASAPDTFEELVGPEHFPSTFMQRFRRLRPAGSAFILYAGTTLDMKQFDMSHQSIHCNGWDLEAAYESSMRGDEDSPWICYIPTLVDPSLAPPGCHVVTVVMARPYEMETPWRQERERSKELVLHSLEQRFPGFRKHLVFAETATPLSLERFTLNTKGAVYGWDQGLEHTGSKRPAQRTSIAGLYLAGHWTRPGAGFLRSTVSGTHTAQMVLADTTLGARSEPFSHEGLPPAA